MATLDPSRIGQLEPGRQTVTLRDRLIGPYDLAAVASAATALCLGLPQLIVARGPQPEAIVFAAIVGIGSLAVLIASLVWLGRWLRQGPTVLVLREGALTLTAGGVTRSVAYVDLAGATARRRAGHSQLVLILADGEPIEVPIGGFFRAQAMADAVTAAMCRSPSATAREDPEVRRALERLRRTDLA
jgi:hypothetical protein